MGEIGSFWVGVFVVLYVLMQLGVGVWVSRHIKTEADYYVAGRRLGVVPVALSVFATWFGAETVLSSSAEIASGGLAGGRAEPFGYALCLVGMGLFIAVAFRARGYLTLADFFRQRFGRRAELACVWLTFPVSIIWAAAQLLALSVLLELAIGAPPQVTLIAATALVVAYTAFGGLMGDVATDMIQSVVLIACLCMALAALAGHFGGFGPMLATIEPSQLTLVGADENWLARADAWAIPVLGSLVTQEAISRFLAAKNPAAAQHGCFGAAGLYLAVGMIPVLLGLAGMHVGAPGAEGDDFLPALIQDIAPPIVFILFSGALLSAILSTADSNLLSVSSLAAVNLFAARHARATPRGRLAFARGATLCAGVIAYLIASSGQSIRELITLTSVLGQGGLLVAVVAGLSAAGFGGERAALAAILASAAANAYAYLVWPFAVMLQAGETLPGAFGLWAAGEAPAADGVFLLSVAVGAIAFLLSALIERSPRKA